MENKWNFQKLEMRMSLINYSFPEISRNVSGNFWKPFPAVSRNIFPEISRKVQFEKKSKGFSLRNFCLKRMRVLTLQRTSGMRSGDQTTFTGTHSESFRLQIHKWNVLECVPIGVAWSPDHVPEVRCSVRTFIRFRKKFLKPNTLLFFSNWIFLEISGKIFLETAGNGFQKFPETFLEISGNE